jgi:cardiolipin synthase
VTPALGERESGSASPRTRETHARADIHMTVARLRRSRQAPPGHALRVSGNDVELLHDGEACFAAMLEAIDGAHSEVLLDMYWFASDRSGRRFADALSRKAREGAVVRIIYDSVGSWEADDGMFDAMRRAGCRVHEYHPVAPWRRRFNIGVVNHRDHRKMLVVDGDVCLTGGINLGDPWAPESEGGGGWRDDMLRIEGPAAAHMRGAFADTWYALEGEQLGHVEGPPPERQEDGATVRILASRHRREQRAIRREYLVRIRRARHRIFIANAYFVPDSFVRRGLGRAAERGVDVRILVPGRSDVPAVHYAGRRTYEWLLASGVQLYAWRGSMLHAKSSVVDGRWCTVGSYNLDWRSWRFNLEVAAIVEDEELGRRMEERFALDLEHASSITLHSWRERALSDRVLERFFYLFRKLL